MLRKLNESTSMEKAYNGKKRELKGNSNHWYEIVNQTFITILVDNLIQTLTYKLHKEFPKRDNKYIYMSKTRNPRKKGNEVVKFNGIVTHELIWGQKKMVKVHKIKGNFRFKETFLE